MRSISLSKEAVSQLASYSLDKERYLYLYLIPCQTLYLHIPVSGHSLASGRRHLYKSENWNFFFCLRFLASGHLMHDKWLLVIKFANQQKIWPLTEQQNSGDRFCHISNCVRVSKLSENTCRLTLCPPSPWSTFVHVSLVNGWRPLMRIILVSGLLYQRTLFSSPRACPLTRELTVSRNCTQNPKTVKKCVWNTIVTSNLSKDLKWRWEHFLNELVRSFYFLRLFLYFRA